MYYTNKQANVTIHNLAKVKIPTSVSLALSLGLKFNFKRKFNVKSIINSVSEGVRKLAWKTFFIMRNDKAEENNFTKILIKIKKSIGGNKFICPLEKVLFNSNFINKCKKDIIRSSSKFNRIHEYLITELSTFIQNNNIVIVESDKNAGLVIMNDSDYKTEMIRQL